MFSRILTALCLLALCGCATNTGTIRIRIDQPDQAMLEKCPPLPKLPEDKPLLLADDATDDMQVSDQYYECALRQRRLVDWVRGTLDRIRNGVH